MRISIMGAGGWGTALSIQALKNGNNVTLWSYSDSERDMIVSHGENIYYLPGVAVPSDIKVTCDRKLAARGEVIVFCVPSGHFRSVVSSFNGLIGPEKIIVSATKGFEYPSGKRMSEILKEELGHGKRIAVISGPSHAEEVARGVPTSITAASEKHTCAETVQKSLSNGNFRIYTSRDITGVEVCAASKNVIAIAAGMLRGFGLGDNTMAALITRGLAEIRRLGLKLKAKEATFAGLAGVGDLIVTCISMHSRNGHVGELLAKGIKIDEILSSMKMIAEGVETVKSIMEFKKRFDIELPISEMVYNVIYNGQLPEEAMKALMQRPLKKETV